jgi:hypothetical protein
MVTFDNRISSFLFALSTALKNHWESSATSEFSALLHCLSIVFALFPSFLFWFIPVCLSQEHVIGNKPTTRIDASCNDDNDENGDDEDDDDDVGDGDDAVSTESATFCSDDVMRGTHTSQRWQLTLQRLVRF